MRLWGSILKAYEREKGKKPKMKVFSCCMKVWRGGGVLDRNLDLVVGGCWIVSLVQCGCIG